MKKIFALIAAVMLMAALFAGCTKTETTEDAVSGSDVSASDVSATDVSATDAE
ncbi:MAG: hypothetical protein LBL82_01975 [Oscillospiraceae bacterium]|jgi:PBP1b-binding outer membrane lipoprotein LpoB|nr:hypothetical protein [Oscillospiraceae bacterium]